MTSSVAMADGAVIAAPSAAPPTAAPPHASTASTVVIGPAASDGRTRVIPTGTWIFGSVALVGLSVGLGAGVDGVAARSDLTPGCGGAGTCDVDGVRTRFVVADIAYGVALLSAAAAIVVALASPSYAKR